MTTLETLLSGLTGRSHTEPIPEYEPVNQAFKEELKELLEDYGIDEYMGMEAELITTALCRSIVDFTQIRKIMEKKNEVRSIR